MYHATQAEFEFVISVEGRYRIESGSPQHPRVVRVRIFDSHTRFEVIHLSYREFHDPESKGWLETFFKIREKVTLQSAVQTAQMMMYEIGRLTTVLGIDQNDQGEDGYAGA